MDNPFDRLKQYSTPLPDGAMACDAGLIALDLILAAKLVGKNLEDLQGLIVELWPQVEVTFHPQETKQ